MEKDFYSYTYHFIPKQKKNRLLIFHQGHINGLNELGGNDLINKYLDNGFDVIGIAMPSFNGNNGPVFNHNKIMEMENESFNPIKIFLEPVSISLNYLLTNNSFKDITMVGISGGGWTTTIYSAIDGRINNSVSIADSLPHYLRYFEDLGDAEQYEHLGIYRITDFLKLYILDSVGNDRKHLQILNQFDSCCFKSDRREIEYEFTIKKRVDHIGNGFFDVIIDNSHHEHKISQFALSEIDKLLEN